MEERPKRVVVVGAGYVGLVTGVGLATLGNSVELVETRRDRLDALRAGRVPIHEAGLQDAYAASFAGGRISVSDHATMSADVVMVCVGTPIGDDGRSDLSQLHTALASLHGNVGGGTPLVIRSTLPPGSTYRIAGWAKDVPRSLILTNPEFLRQGTALDDFMHPARIVIGHFPEVRQATIDLIAHLYAPLSAPVLIVDVVAAELIKNGANAFLALKLSFANEMATMAEEFGTDVEVVLRGMSLDPRIGSTYMRPGLGFGGSCLPKELRALAVAGAGHGLAMHVTNAASEANAAQQRRFAMTVAEIAGGLDGRTVGLLGLAFKAGTDDVRESPALAIARTFLGGGASIRAYDPQAGPNALLEVPELRLADSAEAALTGCDVAVIATDWPEFVELDWASIVPRMASPVVVDGRRLLDPQAMRALGCDYHTVGSGSVSSSGSPQEATPP